MHEFVVTLMNGRRFTVKAEKVVLNDESFVALVDAAGSAAIHADPLAHAVAIFARHEVVAIVDKGHLIEEADPIVVGSDIPF